MTKIAIFNARVGVAKTGGTEAFLRESMKRLCDDHTITCYTGQGEILPEVERMDVEVVQVPYLAKEGRTNDFLSSYTPLLSAEIESLSMFYNAKREGLLDEMERRNDVVSTHYYLDNILLSRWLEIPVLFRSPGIKNPNWRWKLMAKVANHDRLLANSGSTAKRLDDWLGLEIDGIVYAGVDTNQFSGDSTPEFTTENTSILYVGRLDDGKGLPDLLKAHAEVSDTELYIVGDGRLADELKELSDRLGTRDRVQFVGAVPHEDIDGYYAAADIFCLPSYHESLGMVNLEAMATGTAVISTRIDAIQEYLTHEENGLLIEPGDVDALVNSLKRLTEDDDFREEIARAGRATAEEYTWEEQARRLAAHYDDTA